MIQDTGRGYITTQEDTGPQECHLLCNSYCWLLNIPWKQRILLCSLLPHLCLENKTALNTIFRVKLYSDSEKVFCGQEMRKLQTLELSWYFFLKAVNQKCNEQIDDHEEAFNLADYTL